MKKLNKLTFKKLGHAKLSFFREQVKEIREAAAKSANAKKNKESELGFRDSVFLSLPYFNIIRQTIVDPMHNLFSGR